MSNKSAIKFRTFSLCREKLERLSIEVDTNLLKAEKGIHYNCLKGILTMLYFRNLGVAELH